VKKQTGKPFFLFVTIVAVSLLWCYGSFGEGPSGASDRREVRRVIDKMENYYERRSVSRFLGLFSRRKFSNLITFKRAVENDFNMNTNISLRKTSERLSVARGRAIHQAMWEKQYRPILISPHQGRRLKRLRGNVRIYLEKERGGWKVIDLQGYPIFGL